MKNPAPPTTTTETPQAPELPKTGEAKTSPSPEAWKEFLEEDADCCGGCNHKPR